MSGIEECPHEGCGVFGVHGHGSDVRYVSVDRDDDHPEPVPGSWNAGMLEAFLAGCEAGPLSREERVDRFWEWRRDQLLS